MVSKSSTTGDDKNDGVNAIESSDSEHANDSSKMKVTVLASNEAHFLAIPFAVVVQRELEMQQTAQMLGIPPQRWSGSLLFRQWKKQKERAHVHLTFKPDTDNKTLAASWADRDTVGWIETYYMTGKLQIPRTARGYDVLAAVEYFGILYQPDQCHFQDYAVYKRVQQWSRYLCHRATLATWVVHQLETTERQTVTFVTAIDGACGIEVEAKPLIVLGFSADDVSEKSLNRISYKLFNSPESDGRCERGDDNTLPATEETTADEMREDFSRYLESALHDGHSVTFTIKPIKTSGSDKTVGALLKRANRAVLTIRKPDLEKHRTTPTMGDFTHAWTTGADLITPFDERVNKEVEKGDLDALLKQVEERRFESDPLAAQIESGTLLATKEDLEIFEDFTGRLGNSATPPDKRSTEDCVKAANAEPLQSDSERLPSKKKKRPKPHFELPDKMLIDQSLTHVNPVVKSPAGLNPAPIHMVRTGTYDNTVTSALTGPFYLDDDGNLRDVFEKYAPQATADDEDDEYPGMDVADDDTRAQARRHEWIQAALLNRGINERMETLLNVEGNEKEEEMGMDAWDWFTGLGVCQLSRSMMESMGQYAADSNKCSPAGKNEPAADVEASPSHIASKLRQSYARAPQIIRSVFSYDVNEPLLPSKQARPLSQTFPAKQYPSKVKDRLGMVQRVEDGNQQQCDEKIPFDVEQYKASTAARSVVCADTREDGILSRCSKESPTSVVQQYDAQSSSVLTPADPAKTNKSTEAVMMREERNVTPLCAIETKINKKVDQSGIATLRPQLNLSSHTEQNRETNVLKSSASRSTNTPDSAKKKKSRRGLKALFRRR